MMLGVRSSRAQALGLVRRRANHSGALPLAGHRPEVITRKLDGKADSGDVPRTAGQRRLLRPFSQDPRGFRAHDGGEQQGDAEEVARARTRHGFFASEALAPETERPRAAETVQITRAGAPAKSSIPDGASDARII